MSHQILDGELNALCVRRISDARRYLAQLISNLDGAETAVTQQGLESAWAAFVRCKSDADGMHQNFSLAEAELFELCADSVGLGHLKPPAQTSDSLDS
jgi:hypothetical protein